MFQLVYFLWKNRRVCLTDKSGKKCYFVLTSGKIKIKLLTNDRFSRRISINYRRKRAFPSSRQLEEATGRRGDAFYRK